VTALDAVPDAVLEPAEVFSVFLRCMERIRLPGHPLKTEADPDWMSQTG